MKSIAKKKASEHTSYEVRHRWDLENHKQYTIRLRLKEDADLIKYIEAHKKELGTSNLFKAALEKYTKEGL